MTERQPPHHPGQQGPTGPGGPNGPSQSGPGFIGPGQGGSGPGMPYPPNRPPGAQPPHPQPPHPQPPYPQAPFPPGSVPPQNMPPRGMAPQGYGPVPGQPPPPGQGWGPPPPGFGGPPPPRKGPGGWVWGLLALAIALVLGTVVYAMATLYSTSGEGVAPTTPPPVNTTAATPSSATPSETESPKPVPPPANPHASEGLFLSPAYAAGGTSVAVTGESYLEMVGASADGSIVAVNSDYQLRGISSATSKVVWTYPAYSCSQGSWDGVVLCGDTDDPQGASSGGPVPDIVGIDLSTGKALFRFAPEHMAGRMDFIGADDAHGYFRVSLLGIEEHSLFGKHHVLAINKDGSIAWMTPLEVEGFFNRAALISDNQISVSLEKSVLVLDRATGAVTTNLVVGESLVDLLWDGWGFYVSGDALPNKVFDLQGALVAEYRFTHQFIPAMFTMGISAPAYARSVLDAGETGSQPIWGVTRDGERVVGDMAFGIIKPNYEYLAEGSRLEGISGDGSLFLSDLDSGTIHDSRDGSALASFPPPEAGTELVIVDGIVSQELNLLGEAKIVVMLPGS